MLPRWVAYFFMLWCGESPGLVVRGRDSAFRRCCAAIISVGAGGAILSAVFRIDAVHLEDSRPFVIGNDFHDAVTVCYEDVHGFLHIDERLSGISSYRNLSIVNPRFFGERGDFSAFLRCGFSPFSSRKDSFGTMTVTNKYTPVIRFCQSPPEKVIKEI